MASQINKCMARHFLVWGAVIALLLIGIVYIKVIRPASANHDELAKCLSANGAVFYGAYWCPHCQDQKKMFGSSAGLLPYVECAVRGSNDLAERCVKEEIKSFPTWKFASGEVVTGAQPLVKLAELSGCKA